MIDHVCLNVSDLARSKTFYAAALGPVGYGLLVEFGDEAAGFGVDRPTFWLGSRAPVTTGTHVAFSVDDRASVDAFHAAALAAGGADHGAPGVRPHYHEHYYGAFVLDPDGHNVEAVCHASA